MGSGRFLALVARVHSFRRIGASDHLGQQEQVQQHDKLDESEHATISGRHENERIFRRFEADLAVRVQQLQLQGSGGSAHLNWLLDACAATLSTHSSLAPLLLSLSPPPPASTHERRADEVLSLLDLCTSLKHMADDVDRQLSLLQRALHRTGQALHRPQGAGATTVLQSAARRLHACLDGLQFLGGKQYKDLAEAQAALLLAAKRIQVAPAPPSVSSALPLNYALDGTLLISVLMLASTLSSFAAPTSRPSGAMRSACKLIARYASTCSKSTTRHAAPTSWVGPLRQLQRDLKQEEMSCVFLELQRLQASASSLHDALLISPATPADHHIQACGELRHSVDNLRKSSQEAQASISALRSHLASLFQALVALRLALLPAS